VVPEVLLRDRPAVFFDDGFSGELTIFADRRDVIRADRPEEVGPALEALQSALAAGNYAAGYLAYEAGYALEPRLKLLETSGRRGPLLWFGVFGPPAERPVADLDGWCTGRAYAGPLAPEWDAAAYAVRFERVKALIAAGDFYQANLTFRARFPFAGDPLALYAKLRPAAGARYGAYIDTGAQQILSLSPELFFEISDGVITAKPMKGTARRERDPEADARARTALAQSTKNRAENLMIVDLLRNDLGRIAELGSVTVPDLFTVETYPTVHQMVSTVSARLKPGIDVPAIVRALFPCGSVTGAPKIRAMETIADLEASPRGVYCGAIGWFAPDGGARFNVAIRTLTVEGGRGELGIGGGLVQDSECADEYAEALLKARYYEADRRPLELIETLRWSAEEGFVRRDLHLDRMQASAAFFGLPFDRGRALDVLDEATYALGLPSQERCAHRLRLTLDESGEIACTTARLAPAKDVWTVAIADRRLRSTDPLARHKINWREAYDSAPPPGIDELVFLNERGEMVEGARTNVFVACDDTLMTPPLSAGCLDGVLRRALLAEGRAIEAPLTSTDLAGEFYLGNSLRGLIRGVFTLPPLPPGRR
jgi:para-aminobenzoate synthetase / 4-amino-4-deoxychorismate lyase